MSDRFKLGDRVKIDDEDDAYHGEKGIVVYVSPGGIGTMVCRDEGLRVDTFDAKSLKHFVQPEVKMICTRRDLEGLKVSLGVRDNWHEPDKQSVTATVRGRSFDNAGFWGEDSDDKDYQELYVEVKQDGEPVARVNLATLFAWATGHEA